MSDYIEREMLLEKTSHMTIRPEDIYDYGIMAGVDAVGKLIKDIPAADVAPVVHGRWEPVLEGVWNLPTPICVGWSCSLCGRYEQYKEPYCNCGARMDGE